jgi:hypothetical protein
MALQTLSARTDPSRPRVSPAERDYLIRQGNSILVNGGSPEDVVNFARIHIGRVPEMRRERIAASITTTGGNPPQDPNMLLGLSTKAYQGATFGFGDEFVGTLMGILPGGTTPAEGREMYRDVLRAGTGSKIVDILAELAGGVATGATAARAVGLGSGVLAQAGAGAAGGVISGFGNETGTVSDRSKSALLGGAFGGVLGGAFGIGAKFAAPFLKPAARAVLDRFGALQRRLPGLGSSEDHARRVILDVLDAEGVPLETLRENVVALRANGVSPTLADAGGEGTLALLAETLGSRTTAKQQLAEMLLERQAAQGERLSGSLFDSIFRGDKFGLRNAYDAVDDLSETMSRLAAPDYIEAHRLLVPVSGRMKTLIGGNPKLRAAYEEAKRIGDSMDLTSEGQAELASGRLQIPALPSGSLLKAAEEELLSLNVSPERMRDMLSQLPDEFPSELPVRALDIMQQGLRRVKERLLRGGGIEHKEFQAINGALEEILEEAYIAAPVFQRARQTWAGFSAAKDAVALGQEFARKAPEIVEREITALGRRSEGLADFYRLGAMQNVFERSSGSISKRETADIAREIYGGRILRVPNDLDARRIRALFGRGDEAEAAADDFMRRVVAETRLSRTAEAVGSSRPRAGTAFQEAEQRAEGLLPFGRASAILNAYSVARQTMIQGSKGFRTEVADDIARFFSRGIDSAQGLDIFIDSLEDFRLRQLAADRFGRAFKGGVSTMLGAGVGNIFGN